MYQIVKDKIVSFNPATKEKLGDIKITTEIEMTEIISRCRQSFEIWKHYSFERRGEYLVRLADYLEKNSENLAKLMTKEMGRPLAESIPEIIKSAKFLRYFATEAEKLLAKEEITGVANKIVHLMFEPYGVVALIKPWNMPLQTPIWAMAPALMAGNAIAFKPSENSLLVAKELQRAIEICEFPQGLIGFIYGEKEQGRQLLDKNIDMVSFTGSAVAGKQIASQVASRFIKTSLELGGKDPMIVFDDANIDFAAMAAVWGSTTNCGQFCSSIERVYVQEKIFNEFVNKASELCKAIKVGNGLNKGIEMGPVVNEIQYNKILSQIRDAVKNGAIIVTGGDAYNSGELSKGLFIQPTLLVGLNNSMRIMQEETFGPIVRAVKFSTAEEAITLANESEYGLGSSIITQDEKLANMVASQMETGMVWINEPLLSHEKCPWIPRKNSGLGYELGVLGIKEFVQTKIVNMQFTDNDKMRGWWYPYKLS